jgi:hypothetical protein
MLKAEPADARRPGLDIVHGFVDERIAASLMAAAQTRSAT